MLVLLLTLSVAQFLVLTTRVDWPGFHPSCCLLRLQIDEMPMNVAELI
jgi:hypothetical protein